MTKTKTKSFQLLVYHSRVKTPFGLLGCNEKALTFALGYTLYKCTPLLQQLLLAIDVKVPESIFSSMSGTQICLEKVSEEKTQGRRDIEIKIPGCLLLIIEGKIRGERPEIKQLKKYLNRLRDSKKEKEKKLLMILDSDDDEVHSIIDDYCMRSKYCRKYRKYLEALNWKSIVCRCQRLEDEGNLTPNERVWLKRFRHYCELERLSRIYFNQLDDFQYKGKELWNEVKMLVKTKGWTLSRDPPARGLYGDEEPWCAFVTSRPWKWVFGVQLCQVRGKEVNDWHLYFNIPKKLAGEIDNLPQEVKNRGWWENNSKDSEYWYIWVKEPRKDVAKLKGIFESAYLQAQHRRGRS